MRLMLLGVIRSLEDHFDSSGLFVAAINVSNLGALGSEGCERSIAYHSAAIISSRKLSEAYNGKQLHRGL
jgi:hypothetical protein